MASRRRKAAPRRSPRVAKGSRRTPVDRLRAICLALPETTEKLAWSEPTWRVRGKLFAQLDDHHHGADHLAVWLPAPLGEQEAMIFTDPARFFRPPYVGVRGWVGVRIDGAVDWAVVSKLVAQAYAMVAPPRLRAVKDAPDARGVGRRKR
jgi:predicted DNA-binding protein (MmcQ/YjbR family)